MSGPSGVGKNAVEQRLRLILPELQRVVTMTTRSPRPNEQEGVDYHFVTKHKFQELAEANAFIEWAVVHDQMYGALKSSVEQALEQGRHLLLIVDVQGALKYKEVFPEALLIFLEPESMDQLKKHLARRSGSDQADLELRLKNAEKELALRDFYDEIVINSEGKLQETARQVANLIQVRLSGSPVDKK